MVMILIASAGAFAFLLTFFQVPTRMINFITGTGCADAGFLCAGHFSGATQPPSWLIRFGIIPHNPIVRIAVLTGLPNPTIPPGAFDWWPKACAIPGDPLSPVE